MLNPLIIVKIIWHFAKLTFKAKKSKYINKGYYKSLNYIIIDVIFTRKSKYHKLTKSYGLKIGFAWENTISKQRGNA